MSGVDHPGQEAELSCGDIVTEWDPPVQSEKHPHIWTTKCVKCHGAWRRVVEIRARTEEAG